MSYSFPNFGRIYPQDPRKFETNTYTQPITSRFRPRLYVRAVPCKTSKHLRHTVAYSVKYTVWVKKTLRLCGIFFQNGSEFFDQILHAYYALISMLEYKILFNYLQLWRSYAILSATTHLHHVRKMSNIRRNARWHSDIFPQTIRNF